MKLQKIDACLMPRASGQIINMVKHLAAAASLVLSASFAQAASTSASINPQYRLGIVLVVDQFRADYLTRFEQDFLPPTGGSKGYRFLMNKGAYFPIADHELLQNMTCPGHASILSGAYPYRHGIGMNYWFNRKTQKGEYCVADSDHKLVGQNGPIADQPGMSPKNYFSTTVGDELKNIDRASRVVSIAVKDRSAILMGGQRADHVFWFREKHCQWLTSTYYSNELPSWVKSENERIVAQKNNSKAQGLTWGPHKNIAYCSKESIQTPWAIENTFELAKKAIKELKLGQGKDFDLLTISLSSHDYLGHQIGPNSPHMKTMTIVEDRLISSFLNEVAKQVPGGLENVFVVLTGDHGTPPSPGSLPENKIKMENVAEERLTKLVEDTLIEKFGKPRGGKWIAFVSELQLYLADEALKGAKISSNEVLQVLRPKLEKEYYIDRVFSKDEIVHERKVPPLELGRVFDRTLTERSGDIIIVLRPYFYSDSYPVTHMTHYSYDRYVPLIYWGKSFKPGVYRQIARTIDIAPTLSSLLGVVPPVHSEGKVLSEIIKETK